MRYLSESDAGRIRGMLPGRADESLRRWTERLLEDRALRSRLILRLARGLFLARRAIRQGRYGHLDELLSLAHTLTRQPWGEHLTCAKCGAPATGSATAGAGKPNITLHPDGKACEGGQRVVVAGVPLVDELGFPTKE